MRYAHAEKTGKLNKSLGAKKPKSLIRIVKIAMATMVTYA
jgi:UDP-N-acetylglucosamine pyrophosphorylase